jgi:isocitrate dehydrogenase
MIHIGLMRRGWNGISISRDTIHLPGMKMGYKNKCLFDRHAVGGEYGAAYKIVGPGTAKLSFVSQETRKETIIDSRDMSDKVSAIVVYDNPYDNVHEMAHHFFSRCLEAKVTPYVVSTFLIFYPFG